MAENKFTLCSSALVMVGANKIASFEDDSVEAVVAGELYEKILQATLCGSAWRFATVDKSLGARLSDGPEAGYTYAYQLPVEPPVLEVRTALIDDDPIPYEILGDKLFCDEAEGVVLRYVWRPDEARFPPWFAWPLTLELAAAFARSFDRTEKSAQLKQDADRAWAMARKTNAQQQTTKPLSPRRRLIAGRMR